MKKMFACLLCLYALSGCVATQSLSQQDKLRIKGVALNKEVQKAKEMSYLGPGGGIGLLSGAAGGLATYIASIGPRQALQEYAEKNNILIENIVANEIAAEIKRSGKLHVSEANPDAILNISIRQYGFSIPHGFSSRMVPTLSVVCMLVDKNGAVLWQTQDSVLPLGNPVEGVALEALNDAKVIQSLWQAAAARVAKNIVSSL